MAVEGFFENKKTPVEAKVGDLTPQSKAVNVTAKTGVVYLTLWDDNIEKVNEGDTVRVENGYVTLFKGNIRLNIGKYGKLEPAKEPLTVEVNTENNVSSKAYEQERRPFRGRGGGRGGYGGGGGGYGGRDRGRGGYGGGGGGYGGRDRGDNRDRRGGGGYRPRY
ncbi:MAG: single-stranded DNA-binding protein [Candidatus Bathyarchaeia archaeon]